MASVSASMATMAFNRFFYMGYSDIFAFSKDESSEYIQKIADKLWIATFDSRVFTIPKDEVCNCLIWRQQDATRNSIESVGQAYFSHQQLHCKTCNDIQEMLWREKKINWNSFPTDCKRGAACYRIKEDVKIPDHNNPAEEVIVKRNRWIIDKDIPVFTQDRAFVERWLL